VFLSQIDPPLWAAAAAKACRNEHTWPVLVGEVMLSAPIILYDHPVIAPESPGDFFDSTEIDELLTLRTMTLTDEEKRAARATDPRAAELLDRVDTMPPEVLERLHGAVRYLRRATGPVEPERVAVPGGSVGPGSRVRLRPSGRADAQDMFLRDRTATVEAILSDVDGSTHLALTLDDDPGADLNREMGRFLYFAPDDVEVVP
jgi:hypothetical protein